MDIKLGQPEINLAKVREMTAVAAQRHSDIIVLPELWSTGYKLEQAANFATSTNQGVFADMADLAVEFQIDIVGSCLSVLAPGKFGNTAVYFDKKGHNLGTYSKVHLFGLMDEDKFLSPGKHTTMTETSWGKQGLAICYDLRFPELFRHYALAGATAVYLPAEWPYPRLEHWRTLLQARAIENQMFIIACNRVGTSKDTTFFGHSVIIDPWGKRIIEGNDEEAVLTATIEFDMVKEIRAKILVFDDRRPDVY